MMDSFDERLFSIISARRLTQASPDRPLIRACRDNIASAWCARKVREARERRVSAHRDIHGSHPAHGGVVAKEGDGRLIGHPRGRIPTRGRRMPILESFKAQLGEMM